MKWRRRSRERFRLIVLVLSLVTIFANECPFGAVEAELEGWSRSEQMSVLEHRQCSWDPSGLLVGVPLTAGCRLRLGFALLLWLFLRHSVRTGRRKGTRSPSRHRCDRRLRQRRGRRFDGWRVRPPFVSRRPCDGLLRSFELQDLAGLRGHMSPEIRRQAKSTTTVLACMRCK